MPKLIAATEKFDMIPKRDHVGGQPRYCTDADDAALPDSLKPFFLKADAGPKWAAGGLLVKPLARPAQTGGKFAIARIEGVGEIETVFAERALTFESSHHAFLIDQGEWSFKIGGGEAQVVRTGETVFVPAGMQFSLKVTSAHGAAYAFTNGGGIVEMLIKAGQPYAQPIISEDFPTGLKGKSDAGEVDLLEKTGGLKIESLTNGAAVAA